MNLTHALQVMVKQAMAAYQAQPSLIAEHANQESDVQSGGYFNRQLYELIQNGADQIQDADIRGNVAVVLTETSLYCANQGTPVTEEGIRALLQSHLSSKKGGQIGRFGIGFKSLLKSCDQPEIFSTTVNFRFNPANLQKEMTDISPGLDRYPKMRTGEAIDRRPEIRSDPILKKLLSEFETVIRLKLRPSEAEPLRLQMESFPAEFLTFTPHVERLTLRFANAQERLLRTKANKTGRLITVFDNENSTKYRVFTWAVELDSLSQAAHQEMDDAFKRALTRGNHKSLPITWAVPQSEHNERGGHFWTFFPTHNEMTLPGILNAPWKTTSDRENMHKGEFNRELLRKAAKLITRSLPQLNTKADPVRFLDALPARESKDWADKYLGDAIIESLGSQECMATMKLSGLQIPSKVMLLPEVALDDNAQKVLTEVDHLVYANEAHRKANTKHRRARAKVIGCPIDFSSTSGYRDDPFFNLKTIGGYGSDCCRKNFVILTAYRDST